VAKALPSAGYSGRSLPEKLGFKPGMVVLFIALPDNLAALAASADFAEAEERPRWSAVSGSMAFDAIHAFTTSHAEIAKNLVKLQKALKRDGMIWVSWPKKAAKVATDITEDVVRAEALKLDLVDVKVAAVDAVWSGLKLVIRKERR
jgi:hypothetical protein